jgi:beta-phosphoglucomutase
MMIKAVFFDFDGVITDSKPIHDASWRYAVKTILNVTVDELPEHKMSGKAPKLIAQTLCELYDSEAKHQALLACKNEYLDNYLQNTEPIEGVATLFQLLKDRNIPFGIASNASKHFVIQCLKNWNLDVAVAYGYEDYDQPKPNPEPYLKLANFFNLKPEDYGSVLVFEDSETGLQAALAAEMRTVHIQSHCVVSEAVLGETDYSYAGVLEALELFTS